LEGGPADLRTDRELESSDTNPDALDPSEQSKVADREGASSGSSGSSGSEAQTQFRSSESGEDRSRPSGSGVTPLV
jgi:hypothetical protein